MREPNSLTLCACSNAYCINFAPAAPPRLMMQFTRSGAPLCYDAVTRES